MLVVQCRREGPRVFAQGPSVMAPSLAFVTSLMYL